MSVLESIVARLKGLDKRVLRLEALEVGGVWTNWTPTIDQAGAVACTVTEAKYSRIGKVVHAYAVLAVTAAGTANNNIVIGGIPSAVGITLAACCVGSFVLIDSGGNTPYRVGAVYTASVSTVLLIVDAATAPVGQDPNFALANGDAITFTITYRIA